jgi:energy-coupling factor transport system permease protein
MNTTLAYHAGESRLHKMNPVAKLLIAFLICAACFITPYHAVVLGLLALTVILAFTCGSGLWALGVVKSLAILSIILFNVQTLCTRSGEVLFTIPPGIGITDYGLSFSALFVLRLIASALPLALVLRVTKGTDLARSLNKTFKVPYKYAFAVSMAMRFVPDFAIDIKEITEAQTARGVRFDKGGIIKKLRLLLPLCLPLLLSSVRKSETAAISAELRGVSLRQVKI